MVTSKLFKKYLTANTDEKENRKKYVACFQVVYVYDRHHSHRDIHYMPIEYIVYAEYRATILFSLTFYNIGKSSVALCFTQIFGVFVCMLEHRKHTNSIDDITMKN